VVELRWSRTSNEGKKEKFYVDILEDAIAISLTRNMPHAQNPSSAEYTQLVNTTFRYRKINDGACDFWYTWQP